MYHMQQENYVVCEWFRRDGIIILDQTPTYGDLIATSQQYLVDLDLHG